MIPAAWRDHEVAVIGLARSGLAAARLLRSHGLSVYASDKSPDLAQAAAEASTLGCSVELGGHDLARIARAGLVVLSPGVPPDAAPVAAALKAGVPVISELGLAARLLPGTRLIVTTGTKGKSTTAACIAHLLGAAGLGPAKAAGNIGSPLSLMALEGDAPAWLSVEASSFQLHDSPSLAPAVGVVTNLSPDHLDRYSGLDAYYADKALLFRNATEDSKWVVNADDAAVLTLAAGTAGRRETFSLALRAADAWFDRAAGWLVLRGAPLVRRSELMLLGDHNVANVLAALLALPREADRDVAAAALRSFRPLPNRLEPVREVGGVLWVNDSKGTILSATRVALESVMRPTVLLLGGRAKTDSFTSLAASLSHVRAVVAYGEAAALVERDLAGAAKVVRAGDFADVVRRASELARPGDAVLLSPACTSFDMFRNAEERGERFRELVRAL